MNTHLIRRMVILTAHHLFRTRTSSETQKTGLSVSTRQYALMTPTDPGDIVCLDVVYNHP